MAAGGSAQRFDVAATMNGTCIPACECVRITSFTVIDVLLCAPVSRRAVAPQFENLVVAVLGLRVERADGKSPHVVGMVPWFPPEGGPTGLRR